MDAAAAAQRIADNLAGVRDGIARAGGGGDVRLVCVTKYASVEPVRLLLQAGATELGENLLPQGAERFEALRSEGYEFMRHLIGPLQSRKVALAARSCDWFQALDRSEIARKLDASAEALERLNVLIQLNLAAEPQKSGIAPEHLPELLEAVARLPNLRLCGLMCIPPGPQAYASAAEFERGTRSLFRQAGAIFARIAPGAREWDTLSMGMSQDFRWAVEEGSTLVRVGSALFEGLSSPLPEEM